MIRIALLMVAVAGFAHAADESSEKNTFQALESKSQPEKVLKLITEISISQRETGPFGLSQDLTVQKITKTQKRVAASNEFSEAIAKISINVVLGKSFLIGSREIKEGGTFPLVYKGNRYNIKVISVRANQITFKNMDTAEQVIKKMGGLPQGFEKSKGKESFPGVVPAGGDQGAVEIGE